VIVGIAPTSPNGRPALFQTDLVAQTP
jgi:hypothetical protein